MRLFPKHFDLTSISLKELKEIRKGDKVTLQKIVYRVLTVIGRSRNSSYRLVLELHNKYLSCLVVAFDVNEKIHTDKKINIEDDMLATSIMRFFGENI